MPEFPFELMEGGALGRIPAPASQHHRVKIFRAVVSPWQPVPILESAQPLLIVLPALLWWAVRREEVFAANHCRGGAIGKHLPQGDAKGPDVTLWAVLPQCEALDGLPFYGDSGCAAHYIEVVLFGFPRQPKVRDLHSFLVGDKYVPRGKVPVDYLVVSEVLMLIHN